MIFLKGIGIFLLPKLKGKKEGPLFGTSTPALKWTYLEAPEELEGLPQL